jgi:hypothetical protein
MSTSFEKSKAASLSKIREHKRLYDLAQMQNRITTRTSLVREQLLIKVWRNRDTPMNRYENAERKKERAVAKQVKLLRNKEERKRKVELKKSIEKKISTIRVQISREGRAFKKSKLHASLRSLQKTIPKFYLPNGACEECKRHPCECDAKLRFRSKYPYVSTSEAKIYLLFLLGCYTRETYLKSAILIQRVVRGRQDRFYVAYLRKQIRMKWSKILRKSLRREISKRESNK